MKLTQRRIDDLKCEAGKKDRLVFDEEQTGLAVRVTTSGGKNFLAQYTYVGSKRRIPLGSCSAISLASAREAVKSILGDVAKGRDPAAERKQVAKEAKESTEQQRLTLGVLIDRWEAGGLSERRASYRAEATRALRFAFAMHLNEPAASLGAR